MKKMCIYEPALCCETGLCGVNVDPYFYGLEHAKE